MGWCRRDTRATRVLFPAPGGPSSASTSPGRSSSDTPWGHRCHTHGVPVPTPSWPQGLPAVSFCPCSPPPSLVLFPHLCYHIYTPCPPHHVSVSLIMSPCHIPTMCHVSAPSMPRPRVPLRHPHTILVVSPCVSPCFISSRPDHHVPVPLYYTTVSPHLSHCPTTSPCPLCPP